MRTKLLSVLFLMLVGLLPASAAPIVLKSHSTGQYVGKDRAGLLIATSDLSSALRLEIISLNGSQVAFQAADGQFLRAGVGSSTNLMVASGHIRGWETFQQITARGTSVAFMSSQNGLYVSVHSDTAGTLAATADRITNNEMFQVLPVAIPRTPQPPAAPSIDDIGFYEGNWSIVQIANANGNLVDLTPPARRALRLQIDGSGNIGFTAGCNSHSGRLTLTAPRIRVSDLVGTKRLCQGFSGTLESQISAALQASRFFLGSSSSDIYFLDGSSREVLILRRN